MNEYVTGTTPGPIIPICSAAPRLKSNERPGINGPLSLMRTLTHRLFHTLHTRRRVPNGNDLWAAVNPH